MRAETPSRANSKNESCESCGRTFECSPGGDCWCAAEDYRLPMPRGDSRCLCPDCLRKAAAAQK